MHTVTWLLPISLLLSNAASTPETSKLSDLSGEEGVIDKLEELLQQKRIAANQQQGKEQQLPRIQFGVGPKDPRYFSGSNEGDPRDGGPISLQTRGGGLSNLIDTNVAAGLEYNGRYNVGDNYDRYNKLASAETRRNQLLNAYNQRMSEARAFLSNKQAAGDDRQRLVSGGTSQPEAVNFPHLARQAPSNPPPPSKPPQGDSYNPNDPSSNVNIDIPGPVIPGSQVSPGPGHYQHAPHAAEANGPHTVPAPGQDSFSDFYFTALVAGVTAAAICVIIGTGICWYKFSANQRAAKDTEYPAYGVTGPSRELSPGGSSGGDRTLAHSAHMYHYQQQKNQMIAIDKSTGGAAEGASDGDSEEEDCEERDYTVYECPGLAPMGEMIVPNPMYPTEDGTPNEGDLREKEEE